MRILRKLIPFLFLAAITTTSLESCFLFRGKNHCGDCPNFHSNGKPKKVKKHRH